MKAMYAASYRNTERGIVARQQATDAYQREVERQQVLREQRRLYEAKRDEDVRLAGIRAEAAQRAAEMAAAVKAVSGNRRVFYADIERLACRVFGVNRAVLISTRRNRGLVLARQFVMYWAARLTSLSMVQIGRLMGGRDHTTVLHGKDIYPKKRAEMGRYLREVR